MTENLITRIFADDVSGPTADSMTLASLAQAVEAYPEIKPVSEYFIRSRLLAVLMRGLESEEIVDWFLGWLIENSGMIAGQVALEFATASGLELTQFPMKWNKLTVLVPLGRLDPARLALTNAEHMGFVEWLGDIEGPREYTQEVIRWCAYHRPTTGLMV